MSQPMPCTLTPCSSSSAPSTWVGRWRGDPGQGVVEAAQRAGQCCGMGAAGRRGVLGLPGGGLRQVELCGCGGPDRCDDRTEQGPQLGCVQAGCGMV